MKEATGLTLLAGLSMAMGFVAGFGYGWALKSIWTDFKQFKQWWKDRKANQ